MLQPWPRIAMPADASPLSSHSHIEALMMITQALATAGNTNLVYGLLGAYLESVQAHDIGRVLPEELTRLPIRGERDVANRHMGARELYARCVGETGRHDPLLAEIAEVMGAALQRLRAFEELLEHAA
jgi:hypothetical protein